MVAGWRAHTLAIPVPVMMWSVAASNSDWWANASLPPMPSPHQIEPYPSSSMRRTALRSSSTGASLSEANHTPTRPRRSRTDLKSSSVISSLRSVFLRTVPSAFSQAQVRLDVAPRGLGVRADGMGLGHQRTGLVGGDAGKLAHDLHSEPEATVGVVVTDT